MRPSRGIHPGNRKIKRPFPPPAAPAVRDSPAPQDSGRTGRGTGACAGRGWPALPGGAEHTQGEGCRAAGGTDSSLQQQRAALIQKRLQRWRRSGGAAAETGAHAGTACTSERRVHTRVGVKHAAKARGTPPWEPWDALPPPSSTPSHHLTHHPRSDPPGAVRRRTRQRRPGGHAPERSGAGLCQFQMPEDLPDDLAVCHDRDYPQRPPLTKRATRHIQRKHPLQQSCPAPARRPGVQRRIRHPLLAGRRDDRAAQMTVRRQQPP